MSALVSDIKPHHHHHDKVIEFSNRVVEWGQDRLFKDYEKGIDAVGIAARILDYGAVIVTGALESAIIVNKLIFNHLLRSKISPVAGTLLKILSIPLAGLFLGIAVVEGVSEFTNLKRTFQILSHFQADDRSLLSKLYWLRKKYFALSIKEAKKINHYLKISNIPDELKEQSFARIEQKALTIKFQALERRISKGLADEVSKQLPTIIEGLEQKDPKAKAMAKVLVESVSKQAKNKILVHILAMTAITFSMVSAICLLSGVTAGGFFIGLAITTAVFTGASFLLNQGTVARESSKFYDKITKLHDYFPTPHIRAHESVHLETLKAL